MKKKERMLKRSELLATKYAQTMDNRKQLEEDQVKKVEEMNIPGVQVIYLKVVSK